MDFHEISELDQKSYHKQHIEKSELLNTIYYDYASPNFCECKFLQIFADFGHILANYQAPNTDLFSRVLLLTYSSRIGLTLLGWGEPNEVESFTRVEMAQSTGAR